MRQPCEPADPTPIEAPKDLADEKKECVVLDMDTIIVLSNGRVIENGPPAELLVRDGGVFKDMVEATE